MKLPKISLGLLLVLLGIFLLRVPSFWEPYWYGDEGIYLALGQAMQRGAVLYRDIWDNKPPLLYAIYAVHPTLLWAKITATLFVLGTVAGIYFLAKKLLRGKSDLYSLIAATLTGIFLSIPLLEGTIANAELYFVLPIVWGANLILSLKGLKKDRNRLFFIGFLAVVAFLLKVPALFDFMGMFVFLFVYLFDVLWERRKWQIFVRAVVGTFLPIAMAFLIPILFVIFYFLINHALSDFLIASFSQNASYVAVGSGPLAKLSNPLFVKGIILIISTLLLVIAYLFKKIGKELSFLSLWFGFSLYGSLLSNRPYLHYLLQIVPPAILLLVYLLVNLKKYFIFLAVFVLIFWKVGMMFVGAFALHTDTYYQNWFDYVSERKSWEDYVTFFDARTLNSYAVSQYIRENTVPTDSIFVWGDAAFVYVLSDRPAATKFIQAHHLTTIDPKNYDLVVQKLEIVQPKFILISRPGHFAFSKLEELVAKSYQQVVVFEDLHVYKLRVN